MRYPFLLILLFGMLAGGACSDDPKLIIPEKEPTVDSTLVDPPQFGVPFANIPSLDELVMYEVNLRAQSASGDIQGVINDLDRIKSLGVNVVWLMPIHPIGEIKSVNSPYSVQNFREVNPEFGTLDDLRELVTEAHSRDMAVIIDWVANHTAWDNPWIENTEWYTRNTAGEIVIPAGTNWQDVADLNFLNQDMRQAMISAMKYWVLAANIDGFRCDAADFVPRSFWKQAIDSLLLVPNRELILLAEGARNDHFDAGFQMNYSWDFYGSLKSVFNGASAAGLFTTNAFEYASIPAGKQKLRFITNHDESAWDATPVTLFGGQAGSLSAFAIATYLSGVPLIYGSQEIGVTNTVPFFSRTNLNWSLNPTTFASYQKIMAAYAASPALRIGELEPINDSDILAFVKTQGEEEVMVLVNVRNGQQTITMPASYQSTSWTNAWDDTAFNLGTDQVLDPYQFLILKR